MQTVIRFPLNSSGFSSKFQQSEAENAFNSDARPTDVQELLAKMLKRQANAIMRDLTECPPDTIPAHLARLDDLRELIRFALSHNRVADAEGRLSGKQLLAPYTLADFLAALEITRQTFRAPAFVNSYDAGLARIEHKIDVLAGLFAQSQALHAVLAEGGAQ
jgi:hypothetical protein